MNTKAKVFLITTIVFVVLTVFLTFGALIYA